MKRFDNHSFKLAALVAVIMLAIGLSSCRKCFDCTKMTHQDGIQTFEYYTQCGTYNQVMNDAENMTVRNGSDGVFVWCEEK